MPDAHLPDNSMKKLLLTALAASLLATGCASNHPVVGVKSEAQYYQDAGAAMKAGNYNTAVANLEALESQYPVGVYTEQTQLELIYGKYMQGDYAAAVTAADRYIRLHPESTHLDYALYMRGIANFLDDQDTILRHLPVNMAHRDLDQARVAFEDFRQLLSRYPDSPYAADARQRMVYLRDEFAESEMNVARYYKTRHAWVAVTERTRWVIENYPESSVIPEALKLQAESYDALGMKDLAQQTRTLLAAQGTPAQATVTNAKAAPAPVAPAASKRSWFPFFKSAKAVPAAPVAPATPAPAAAPAPAN